MVAHQLLPFAMRNCCRSDWPVHSLMLSFHDLRGLPLRRIPSIVPCSMVFGSTSRQQTWPNYGYLWCLTVDNTDAWTLSWIRNQANDLRRLRHRGGWADDQGYICWNPSFISSSSSRELVQHKFLILVLAVLLKGNWHSIETYSCTLYKRQADYSNEPCSFHK